MPAYNVEDRIAQAVSSVPHFVDEILVVDDGSSDRTAAVAASLRREGLTLIRHPMNRGVGAAITTGYREALRLGAGAIAVMAGDGQMDPRDLHNILDPVVLGQADYIKGNRFLHPDIWRVMPISRLLGNIVLSLLTKITSGYWRIFDSQSGYAAISGRALKLLLEGRVFSRYGYPNDLLARLQIISARVKDVPVRPIYDGQRSGIRFWTVIYPIFFVLLGSLARRLWYQRLKPLLSPATRTELQSLLHEDRSSDHLLPAPPP